MSERSSSLRQVQDPFLHVVRSVLSADCILYFLLLMSSYSSECESLIRKILVLDAGRRISLEQIKSHPWMQAEVRKVDVMSGGLTSSKYHFQLSILSISSDFHCKLLTFSFNIYEEIIYGWSIPRPCDGAEN